MVFICKNWQANLQRETYCMKFGDSYIPVLRMVSGLEFSRAELGSGKSNTVVWVGPVSWRFRAGYRQCLTREKAVPFSLNILLFSEKHPHC